MSLRLRVCIKCELQPEVWTEEWPAFAWIGCPGCGIAVRKYGPQGTLLSDAILRDVEQQWNRLVVTHEARSQDQVDSPRPADPGLGVGPA